MIGGYDNDEYIPEGDRTVVDNSGSDQGTSDGMSPEGTPPIFDHVSGIYGDAGPFLGEDGGSDGGSDADPGGSDESNASDSGGYEIEHEQIEPYDGPGSESPDMENESDRVEDYISDDDQDDQDGDDANDDPPLKNDEFDEYLKDLAEDGMQLPTPDDYGADDPETELPDK